MGVAALLSATSTAADPTVTVPMTSLRRPAAEKWLATAYEPMHVQMTIVGHYSAVAFQADTFLQVIGSAK